MQRPILIPILLVSLLLIACSSDGQEVKREMEPVKTKMDQFSSRTGTITKFIDYNLTSLKASYAVAETRIRKISSGANSAIFYQIEKEGKYNSSTASIEYADLLEVIKALNTLKAETKNDLTSNADYLENKFITVDGFQVGYYVSKGRLDWYLKLDRYGSDNTLFISDVTTIEAAFNEGKNKIESFKK